VESLKPLKKKGFTQKEKNPSVSKRKKKMEPHQGSGKKGSDDQAGRRLASTIDDVRAEKG